MLTFSHFEIALQLSFIRKFCNNMKQIIEKLNERPTKFWTQILNTCCLWLRSAENDRESRAVNADSLLQLVSTLKSSKDLRVRTNHIKDLVNAH